MAVLESLSPAVVHCRTGSLENTDMQGTSTSSVHCRTGSLETEGHTWCWPPPRSLPYRQLRNLIVRLPLAQFEFTAVQAA